MYYFAYGANLSKQQMATRCPDSKPLFSATLPNHRVVFCGWSRRWRGGTATLKKASGEKARGAIYEISDGCLRRLDRDEGYPATYRRLKVTVFDEDGTPVEAVTYVKAGQIEETSPGQQYLAAILQGYRDWQIS